MIHPVCRTCPPSIEIFVMFLLALGIFLIAYGTVSMPLSSALQWDILAEHCSGSFPLSSSAVFPPSPSRAWWEQWKWGLDVSLSFLQWLNAESGVMCCLAPCHGILWLLKKKNLLNLKEWWFFWIFPCSLCLIRDAAAVYNTCKFKPFLQGRLC